MPVVRADGLRAGVAEQADATISNAFGPAPLSVHLCSRRPVFIPPRPLLPPVRPPGRLPFLGRFSKPFDEIRRCSPTPPPRPLPNVDGRTSHGRRPAHADTRYCSSMSTTSRLSTTPWAMPVVIDFSSIWRRAFVPRFGPGTALLAWVEMSSSCTSTMWPRKRRHWWLLGDSARRSDYRTRSGPIGESRRPASASRWARTASERPMMWSLPPTLRCTTRNGAAEDAACFTARTCTGGGAADHRASPSMDRALPAIPDRGSGRGPEPLHGQQQSGAAQLHRLDPSAGCPDPGSGVSGSRVRLARLASRSEEDPVAELVPSPAPAPLDRHRQP